MKADVPRAVNVPRGEKAFPFGRDPAFIFHQCICAQTHVQKYIETKKTRREKREKKDTVRHSMLENLHSAPFSTTFWDTSLCRTCHTQNKCATYKQTNKKRLFTVLFPQFLFYFKRILLYFRAVVISPHLLIHIDENGNTAPP